MSNSARFLHKTSCAEEALLLEVVLPGGSITRIFRNVSERRIVLEGSVDRIKWTLDTDKRNDAVVQDLVEFTIPKAFDFSQVSVIEKFNRGRVLLRFPRLSVQY